MDSNITVQQALCNIYSFKYHLFNEVFKNIGN